MIKHIVVASALLLTGLVTGMGVERFMTVDSAATHRTGGSVPLVRLQSNSAAPASLDTLQLRALLREELGTALTAALANSGTGNSRAAPALPTPVVTTSPQQQQEAMQAAHAIIESGQWGSLERMNFHQQLAQLDPVQREQAMQALVQAIDNGSIELSGGPAL